MPGPKSTTDRPEAQGLTRPPRKGADGGDARLVAELIGALRALQPVPSGITGFQQAIIEEHAELAAALRGPSLVSAGPVIAGVSPDHGAVGTRITISGEGLADVTLVRIGTGRATNFIGAEPTAITLQVPPGATDDAVTVFTPLGVTASSTRFDVTG